MKSLALLLALAAATQAEARPRQPIIDMHMHAMGVADQGPVPMAMCTPFPEFPVWDQRRSYEEIFLERVTRPTCPDPVWSPTTDEALLKETISAMERLNMYGMLGGTPERVAAWRKAAPGRFFPGLDFNLSRGYSPERVRALHASGDLAVLGEITTQYEGVEPSDPRLEPFWALAEELDIPVGIHVG